MERINSCTQRSKRFLPVFVLPLAVSLFASIFFSTSSFAQSLSDNLSESQRNSAISQAQAARAMAPSEADQAEQERAKNSPRLTGMYGPLLSEQQQRDGLTPFGAELFTGGFRGLRADGLNADYRVQPGDQVTLRLWGAVDMDRVLPVDAQGNIFIPAIGPVQVQGVTHQQLDSVVSRAVRRVYPDNVGVYTNLQGVQPIAVFVTGFVNQPGRYVGVPSDSVLYLLDQASGIDDELGS